MPNLLEEIKRDVSFIRSHDLQPKWYKVLKVPILLGAAVGYFVLFGGMKTAIFLNVFFGLALLVHLVYRSNTRRWSRSWLDFVVLEEAEEARADRIGKYYYTSIALNAVVAILISQMAG